MPSATVSVPSRPIDDAPLRPARIAISGMFLIHGLVVANWLARISAVQQKLGLAVGTLGLCLLGTAAGALLSMPLTTRMVGRYGSRRVALVSSLLFCAAVVLPAAAVSAATLSVGLFIFGATAGTMDVSMNTQASELETRYGRPIMTSFHALFSIGGMIGSVMGGAAAGLRLNPVVHLVLAGAAFEIATVVIARDLLDSGVGHRPERSSRRGLLHPALAGLGVIAFCVLLGEGAMADWTAVYLTRVVRTTPALAAAGYAVFSLTMAAGRLIGDTLRTRFGEVATVRTGALISAGGLTLALLIGGMVPALVGFALVGIGFAAIFPITLSAAGQTRGLAPQTGIATVAATGYFGFIIGPPLIGMLAEWVTLRGALGVVAALSATAALLAAKVKV